MELKVGDKVDLVIGLQSHLGFTLLINEEYEGLLYKNEVFTELEEGMKLEGYIKKIREDERIDVSLQPQGFKNVIDQDVEKVYNKIKEKGSLMLTDKSSPESIKFHLQMSKKAFKRAIGSLYKQQLIDLKEDRIELKH
ncbi:MAG TPA: DNA-binding protein [Tenacibaculum sp.]|nr:DNA-binding protein [Tenacibaculum sp.]